MIADLSSCPATAAVLKLDRARRGVNQVARRPHSRTARSATRPGSLAATALALGCLALLAAVPARPLAAAPGAQPWPRWEAHDEANALRIDHGAWSEFLKRNLDAAHPSGISRLRYARVSRVDRLILDGYLRQQAALPISSYKRAEQKAYWINLYNALIVQAVLQHSPPRSLREIAPAGAAQDPWAAKRIRVEGAGLSLDDIEHRILRPLWRDPRVHYALNYASLGCPSLAGAAYTAYTLEEMLEAGARAFVNHPRGVRFEGGRLVVSSLYRWYQDDFGGEAGVLAHLRRYAGEGLAARLAAWHSGFEQDYDWTLNAP